MTDRYQGYYRDEEDPFFDDDYGDRLPPGTSKCSRCEEIVPKSHLETDSGVCISCEDEESEREVDYESLYEHCLAGLIKKPKVGDGVTVHVSGFGGSYEYHTIEKITKNKVWVSSLSHPFLWPDGNYLSDAVFGVSLSAIFDGGMKGREYEYASLRKRKLLKGTLC